MDKGDICAEVLNIDDMSQMLLFSIDIHICTALNIDEIPVSLPHLQPYLDIQCTGPVESCEWHCWSSLSDTGTHSSSVCPPGSSSPMGTGSRCSWQCPGGTRNLQKKHISGSHLTFESMEYVDAYYVCQYGNNDFVDRYFERAWSGKEQQMIMVGGDWRPPTEWAWP